MKYISDIQFALITAIGIVAVIILGSSVRLRGKGLLLAFFVIALLNQSALYVPNLLLRNEVISNESYGKFIEPAVLVFNFLWVIAFAFLFALVLVLKSVQQTDGAIAEARFSNESMTILRALFSFDGRLCRSDYWLKGFLPMLPVSILNNLLAYGVAKDWARPLSLYIALLFLWPGLALIVKRLHDRDKSGWFALIMLIPIVGPFILFAGVWFMKGTDGPNRFGPDPLQPAPAVAAEIASV